MSSPNDRKYLPSHEWHLVEGNVVTIGISQHAAEQLSDITFVELPPVGSELKAGEPFGEIESVKATSELYVGASGKVIEINPNLEDQPELINNEPFKGGWMFKIECSDLADIENLLSAEKYDQQNAE